jgi:hypothetical protein
MANITVTYSFSNSTTADASQVNTNFSDIISGTSDGSKDFSINALTCAGAATFNGTVNLGNATGDDVTFTGYVASTIIPKTNATYDLGSSSLCWQALYLDDGATTGGRINFDAGTTKYIGSSADGADFQFGGFTDIDCGSANLKTYGNFETRAVFSAGVVFTNASATIATGAITVSSSWMIVDTEGAAASDDLDTISGGATGQIVVLTAASSARTVVVKDATGNIQLTGDMSLTHQNDTITLMYNGASWLEIARADTTA